MKRIIKNNKGLIIKGSILLLLIIFFVTLIILKRDPHICEQWTRGFSRWYQTSFGNLFKYVPFSLTEWIMVGIVLLSLILIVLSIINLFKKRRKKSLHQFLNVLIIVMGLLSLYQATAEMAYNREKVPIPLYEQKVDKSEFKDIEQYFIDDLNYVSSTLSFTEEYEIISPYSFEEINDLLEKEFERLDDDYFTSYTTRAKLMTSSWLYRELRITGVTFLPTTEANVNYLSVEAEKPFTYAHELAHTKGVMREEDANLVAAYLLLTSDVPYFRYSGYYYTIDSLLELGAYTGNPEDDEALRCQINQNYYHNAFYNYNYWMQYNLLDKIGEFFNNLYLKSSGQEKGTDSYNDNTPSQKSETTHEITSFSTYQKLYFEIYYNN